MDSFMNSVKNQIDRAAVPPRKIYNDSNTDRIEKICGQIEQFCREFGSEGCSVHTDAKSGDLVFELTLNEMITENGTQNVFYAMIQNADEFYFMRPYKNTIRLSITLHDVWVFANE